ncbi:MAG: S9 family peptidase [Burkholderiales bacterium]|nr:S9 family peptidase [Burkholderiales bacterium]
MSISLPKQIIALIVSIGAAVYACAADDSLTLMQAITPPRILDAEISPDGKHVVAISYTGYHYGLMLIDMGDLSTKILVSGKRVEEGFWIFNKEPQHITWVTNDLLAVDYGIEAESIDLNGNKVADLGNYVKGKAVPEDPDSPELLVYVDEDMTSMAKVNARTGKSKKFSLPSSGDPVHWAFDQNGDLRAVTMSNSAFWKDVTTLSNWYKSKETGTWQKLDDFGVAEDGWIPISVPEKDNSIVVRSRMGRDTYAIFNYDVQKRAIGEMMAGHLKEDIISVDDVRAANFKSVTTTGMKPVRYWFDSKWSAIQQSVDNAFPDAINVVSGNPDGNVLVFTYSDVQPGEWYLLNTSTMSARRIFSSAPQIDPEKMRPMELVSYSSKDGLTIPAYLTKPAGMKGPAPAVVLVHGGPTVRDHWGWNAEVQLLAANGYVVLQPQFRGSSGFGRAFETAGYGQWGLAMQDDITAGVQYLVQAGIADPNKICIYGASYGGYAALWGVAREPALYKCGISFAGVSDIEYMLKDSSDRNDDKAVKQLQKSRIGDLDRNKEQFEMVSPLKHADRIQAPLLIAHGTEDRRVPISHSKKMMRELDRYHKEYEWIEFDEEGHGLAYVKDEYRFYDAMLKFLNKHIGPKKMENGEKQSSESEARH